MENETLALLAEAINKQTEVLKGLDLHTKAPASAGNAVELHGDGSLFGGRSIERDVISAHVRPYGLGSELPVFPSVFERPFFSTLTGFTGENGDEPVNPCDDAPTGFLKGCDLTAQFGRVVRDTNTVEIDKVMLQYNRGDFTDLQLRGRIFGQVGLDPNITQEGVLSVVTKSEMVIVGVNLQRKLSRMLWSGNPANNTANGGYKEFPGLDRQVATGQVDAQTGVACPALDSDVKSFAYDAVDGNGRDIVEYMSEMEFYITQSAEDMGLLPAEWVWVMRPEAWHEISAVWPCRYNTNKCASNVLGTDSRVILDGRDNIADRDSMRRTKTIDINGRSYQVILDTGIPEQNNVNNANLNPGQYASTIYFLPLRIVGSFPVLYMEHIDYRRAAGDIALLRGRQNFWTDDGMYFWAFEDQNYCFKLKTKVEPRVILRTPQLAGRIDAVKYEPLQHLKEGYPDSAYFFDGGLSARGDAEFFSVWK